MDKQKTIQQSEISLSLEEKERKGNQRRAMCLQPKIGHNIGLFPAYHLEDSNSKDHIYIYQET